MSPAMTIFTAPGGNSSTGQTSSSANLLVQLQLVEAGPLVGERGALRAVESDLQHAETEESALEPDRRQRNADLLQQVLLGQSRDLTGAPALHHVHQHRRRGLADGAAAPLEHDVADRLGVVLERDRDRDLVAAERILALGGRVGALDDTVPARILV